MSGLDRIREAARKDKSLRFTSLMHHITTELLKDSFLALKRDAAPGVDDVSWRQYDEQLEERLPDVHERVQSGRYRAMPSKRVWIPKSDGRQRPIGIAVLEDKIVQQAVGVLGHSRNAEKAGDYDWACFAAQQSAEKAVKGLMPAKGGEGWGHSVLRLLKDLSQLTTVSESLIRPAMRLDKHYIPTRYPNGFDTGAPKEYYTDEDANQAIEDAKAIVDFCRQSFPDS